MDEKIKIRFIIWGVGKRAKSLCKCIGLNRVVAFIDNDKSKQGKIIDGKKVISFDEYKVFYSSYFIIVTPTYKEQEILDQLESENAFKFFRLRNMPSVYQGYGDICIEEYLKGFDAKAEYAIYGDTAYSLIVYDILDSLCEGKVYIFLGTNNDRTHSLIRECFNINELSKEQYMKLDIDKLLTIRTSAEEIMNCSRTIDIFDLSETNLMKSNPTIRSFRNIHSNEECYIVATGPSLKISDLALLKKLGKICFGVNRIFNVDPEIWTPDYYVMTDRIGIEDNWEHISNYPVNHKFLNISVGDKRANIGEIYKLYVIAGDGFDILPKFSEDIDRKVYGYATVTYATLQLAVYMGFKKIYLLGVDCNYTAGSQNNYFFKEANPDNKNHRENAMVISYISAKKYADEHGISIINATRGGKLDVFPRVDFDLLLEGD